MGEKSKDKAGNMLIGTLGVPAKEQPSDRQ